MGGRMTDAEAVDHGMLRPVWLLNEPLPLDEPLPLPEPLPSSMPQWHLSSMVLEQGPERIESGWWDGKGVARDYYVARQCGPSHSHGARLWVFQERQSKRWYLHGVFA
jgi:protein ImuB